MGLTEMGGHHHPHAGHHIDQLSRPGQQELNSTDSSMEKGKDSDVEWTDAQEESPLVAQILGVATLEFGVIFHVSVLSTRSWSTEKAKADVRRSISPSSSASR